MSLASLSIGNSTARYIIPPNKESANVRDNLVGCGITSNTMVITKDAPAYFAMLLHGMLKFRDFFAMTQLASSSAMLVARFIEARTLAASMAVSVMEVNIK